MISHFKILLLNRCTDLPYVCVDVCWLDPYKDCKKTVCHPYFNGIRGIFVYLINSQKIVSLKPVK